MNDDYRLVLSGDSSDLENSLKAIELYMDALESKDIDAPLDNFLKKLKVIAKEVKNVQDSMGKQEGKSVVSVKDMDKTIESTQNATKHINELKKALDDLQKENISKGIAPDPEVEKAYAKMNKVVNETSENLSKVSSQKIGSDASIQNRIKEQKILNQVTEEYNKISKDSSATKDYTKRLRANRNMTRGYMERSEGTGRLTYDQGARVRSELGRVGDYEKRRKENQRNLGQAREQYSNYRNQQQDLTKRRASGQIDKAQYEKELASIKQEMKAREELIANYEKLGTELDKTIQYYQNSVQQEFKERKVDQQRGTFGRMIDERLPSIGSHAGMAMTGAVAGLYMKGASLSETNRPMVTALGQNSDNMDIDSVRNAYGDLSIDNKLGYNSTDMLKMATSYESSVGHTSDADTEAGAKQLAIGGRSLGIQDQEAYQESMNQIMHTGGVNSSNMKEMQDAFLGGIKQSGMVGRQDEQLKALGSIAEQSGEGRTLTKDQMSNLTAMQSTFAESGSKGLQGEQGANAINSIDQGIKNGMHCSYARISMGWGTQYQGLEGGYDLQKRMDEGISNPENLTDMADMATQMGGSEKEQKYLFNRSMKEIGANLTMEQSDEIFKDAQSGKLSKEELAKKAKKMEKEGSKEGEDNATDYKESKSGKNDQNKAKTDDKAEDTYDLAQPIRDAHSALAGLPTPIYMVIGALGAFASSLTASAAQMGLGRAVGWSKQKVSGRYRGKSTGGNRPPGVSGGSRRGGGTPKSPKGGGTPKSPKGGGTPKGGEGIVDGRGRGLFGGLGMMGVSMIPSLFSGAGDNVQGQQGQQGQPSTGGGMMSSLGTMAQYLAMDYLFSGGMDKIGDIFGKVKGSYQRGGAKGLGKDILRKGRNFEKGSVDTFDRMKGKTKRVGKRGIKGLDTLRKGKTVGKIESYLGKAFDKTKDFSKRGLGKVYEFGGYSPSGSMTKTLEKGKKGIGSLANKGRGTLGKVFDKFKGGAKSGILSHAPEAGKLGGLGKLSGMLGMAGKVVKPLAMLDIGGSLLSGDEEGASKKFGNFIDPFGLGYGKKSEEMAKDAKTKDGWSLWSNGDKDGKNKFQDSLVGKPLSKAWKGITGLFSNDAEASEEDSGDKKKGVKGVKKDNKKKEKMTAEQLREKNNQSETKNLKIYSDLLDRAQKIIESAKGISPDGNTEEGGDLGSSDSDGKKSADKWKSDIRKAAKAMGVNITDKDVNGIASLIQNESGGDPGITQGNIGDINNKNGTPAKGLLQYVPSTFDKYKVKGHGNINSGYDQLLAFFNNKNWKQDYNPGGGWSPTGGRVKGGSGGRGGGGREALSSTYQEAMSTPVLSTGSNYRGSNDASNASTTNRITVNVNVQGGNNPEETGDIIGGRIREALDSNMDIFANEHKRSY